MIFGAHPSSTAGHLQENAVLTGRASKYDLRVVDVQEFELIGYRVRFRQYVHDIPLERMSYLDATNEGDVYQLALYVANPDNVTFDPRGWMNASDLEQLARSAWAQRYTDLLPDGELHSKASIHYILETGQFVPAYEIRLGSRKAVVDAVNGEVIKVSSNKVEERQCFLKSGLGTSGRRRP